MWKNYNFFINLFIINVYILINTITAVFKIYIILEQFLVKEK